MKPTETPMYAIVLNICKNPIAKELDRLGAEYEIVPEKDIPDNVDEICVFNGKTFTDHYCAIKSRYRPEDIVHLGELLVSPERYPGESAGQFLLA